MMNEFQEKDYLLHIERIDSIIKERKSEEDGCNELNTVLRKMNASELLQFHSDLCVDSVKFIYDHFEDLTLDWDVKEHLILSYYLFLIQENNGVVSSNILNQLINDYKKYDFMALESLVIDFIKLRKVDRQQVLMIDEVFKNKAVKKQVITYNALLDIEANQYLDKNHIEELINWHSFDALDRALDKKLVENDALSAFKKPVDGEGNKKKKMALYEKAQKLINSI
ncbi:hypothetical protein AB6A23_01130 [Paenibacillus tarimensis]